MYGRPEDKVIGRDVDEAVGVATVAEDRAADRRFVVAEGWRRRELRVTRADGTSVTVDALTVALLDESGEPHGFLGLQRDLTERGRAEKALTEARMRSEALLGGLPEALVAVDRDWTYTYVNDLCPRAHPQPQRRAAHA